MSQPGRHTRVDDLRAKLRSLGYLDAGVDRFVLAPARATRGPAAIAFLASVRIGLIAAILLGPAAAVGLGGRVPGLLTGPRDAVVLATYMGALFGIAVAVVSFAASLLVAAAGGARQARRARALSVAAGAVVSAVSLAYLTLWWRTANAGFGWAAPVWTGFALVVAVAISLLLGHAVTLTTLAVLVAGRRAPGEMDGVRASSVSSWRVALGAAALAFAAASMLLLLTVPAEPGDRDVPRLTVVPSGLRLRLIAIDGFDPAVFDELSASGLVPSLTAAFGGARATLQAEDTRDPARAWTTIATGHVPDAHGVRGLETRRLAGVRGAVPAGGPSPLGRALSAATDLVRLTRPAIASGQERREKTMWEVAADAGLRTVVVNWWATWPAPADGQAVVLSDRAALRLERGGELDAEISPSSLYERLRGEWPAIREEAGMLASASLPDIAEDQGVAAAVRRSAELDALQLILARRAADATADLLAVYLPGLDVAQHTLLGASAGGLTASAAVARAAVLRDYYVFLDRVLARALPAQPDQMMMVVAAPGRIGDRTAGLLGLTGAAARRGAVRSARVTDVAPTVLYALGLPVSRALAGSPVRDLFSEPFVARYPLRDIATYGRPSAPSAPRSGQPLDEEMIERLRSLGYVR
jgi:hypothetical protein